MLPPSTSAVHSSGAPVTNADLLHKQGLHGKMIRRKQVTSSHTPKLKYAEQQPDMALSFQIKELFTVKDKDGKCCGLENCTNSCSKLHTFDVELHVEHQ